VPRAIPSLAYEYLSAGYATAAFVDHPWISPTFGFDRGFQDFYRFREDTIEGYEDYGFEGVVLRFRRWRNTLPEDRDWFAYLSLTDLDRSWGREAAESAEGFVPRPELDWVPPIAETGRSYFTIPNDARKLWSGGNETVAEYELRYDQTLRLLDKRIGRMLQELTKEGRNENTTICIVGTFGVGFGESGLILDTGTLSDVDMHVPWVLRPAAGSRILRGPSRDNLASVLDVAPTLLELSDIPIPPGMHGRSQAPVLRGMTDSVREFAFSRGGLQHGFGVRDERYSLQYTAPGSRGPYSLRSSWTGRLEDIGPEFRDHLRDRRSDSGPGDLEPSAVEPERTAVMREAGRRWYAWIDQAREVVHQTSWDREPLSDEVLEDLVENGVIAPSRVED
jgi:arylsulfatase A-like enzyme